MRLFAGHFGWPVVPANLAAIALTSIVNYFLGDRWVFSADPKREQPAEVSAAREP
jgi:putative flippase GtrA